MDSPVFPTFWDLMDWDLMDWDPIGSDRFSVVAVVVVVVVLIFVVDFEFLRPGLLDRWIGSNGRWMALDDGEGNRMGRPESIGLDALGLGLSVTDWL